jgi:hypothetical protein
MTNTEQQKDKQSQRSADFRYIPCDAINMGVSNNGVKLLVGVDEMDGVTLELVGIHMTLRTAAILERALKQGLDLVEKETGVNVRSGPGE